MDFEFEIPAEEIIPEKELENRGALPSGWYRATCEDAFPDTKEDSGIKLVFKISRGHYEGREIKDTIWNPEQSKNDEARKGAMQILQLKTSRLGMRNTDNGRVNIRLAVSKEFVLQLSKKKKPYCKTCDDWPQRAEGDRTRTCATCGGALKWTEDPAENFANILSDGVYPLDHYKIPQEVRDALNLPPAGPAPAGEAKPTPPKTPSPGVAAAPPAASRTTTASRPTGNGAAAGAATTGTKEERMKKAMAGF